MTTGQFVMLIVAILGSGGLVGGVVALLKLRPESGQIVVTAAQGAVVVQSGVIETLRAEAERYRAEAAALRLRVTALEMERERERERVAALEAEVRALRAEVQEDKA